MSMTSSTTVLIFVVLLGLGPGQLEAGLEITPGQETSAPGGRVRLPLLLTNDSQAVGLICEIGFDAQAFSLDPASIESLSPDHSVAATLASEGVLRLILYPSSSPLARLPATLQLDLPFQILPDTSTGEYPIVVQSFLVADAQAQPVLAVSATAGAVTVRAANEVPLAFTLNLAVTEDHPAQGLLPASDADGDPLTFSLTSPPSRGVIVLTNPMTGAFTYVPNPNQAGQDSFSFRVYDGLAYSNSASVSLATANTNDPPTRVYAELQLDEDQPGSMTPAVDDLDTDDHHSFQVIGAPLHGDVIVADQLLTYRPEPNFFGTDQFAIQATDSAGVTVAGTVHVIIAPVNDPPQAASAAFSLDEDSQQTLIPIVTDVDDATFLFSVVNPPQHGSAFVLGNALVYRPTGNYNGSDAFTFRVQDSHLAQLQAVASIQVRPVNDPPTATTALLETCRDSSAPPVLPEVEDVDRDIEGDSFTFTLVGQAQHGTAAVIDNQLSYQPDPGFSGSDGFTFLATDTGGATVEGLAQVTVNPLGAVRALGDKAQGLTPLVLHASTNCGTDGIAFQWLDNLGTLLSENTIFIVDPPPAVTTEYALVALEPGNPTPPAHRFRILVNPHGLDLDGDGSNSFADLLMLLPTWPDDPSYDADDDQRLTLLDLLYVHTGTTAQLIGEQP